MTWRLLPYRCDDAFTSMAIDEAILRETVRHAGPPTLRFYGWQRPAVSIGYFQDIYQDIDIDRCRQSGVDIVRRLTGGKAVYHRDEITYSLVACRSDSLFPDDILGTYEIVSRCLSRALSYLGIQAALAGSPGPDKDQDLQASCFSTPSDNELLVDGRKICGSAQVRRQGGFLQHGSILLSFDPNRTAELILPGATKDAARRLRRSVTAVHEIVATPPLSIGDICDALKQGFCKELDIAMDTRELSDDEKHLSRVLTEKKYANTRWNYDRKHDVA